MPDRALSDGASVRADPPQLSPALRPECYEVERSVSKIHVSSGAQKGSA